MPQQSVFGTTAMRPAWYSSSIREGRRTSRLPHISRNCTRHKHNGSSPASGQVKAHPHINTTMASESLVGLLQHATKVVKPGRTFVSRMYATAAKVKRLSFYTRLNKGFCSDLLWWHMFIKRWNGVSFFHSATLNPLYIQTDARRCT